jgi:hypothetical protein
MKSCLRLLQRLRNKLIFYGELLAPRPTPKLEDGPLSAVRDCLFNILEVSLHPQPEHAQDGDQWRALVNTAMTLGFHKMLGSS